MDDQKNPYIVLHIEDNSDDTILVHRELSRAGIAIRAITVDNKKALHDVLESHKFDIVLADYGLPGFNGIDALNIVHAKDPFVPFIFVTGTLGEEKAVDCLKAGGTDFVRKEFLSRLVPAFNRALEEAEEKRLRNEAEAHNKQLSMVVDQTTDSVIITRLDGTIEYVNTTFKSQTGYSSPEVINKHVELIWDHDGSRSFYNSLLEEVAQGLSCEEQLSIQRKDKSLFLSKTYLFPIKNKADEIESIAIFLNDISKEKDLEKRLNQAQKLEAIGALAGGITHDFNNILSAILGFSDLALEEKGLSPELQEDLNEINNAGKRATTLVQQILSFCRSSDEEMVEFEPVPVIKEVIKMLRATLPATIAIEHNLPEILGSMVANPTHIHQIVMNLCTNAFHAMENSGGTLQITARVYSSNNTVASGTSPDTSQSLLICVHDTGKGIHPKIKDKIFKQFFTTKGPGAGTGLGLSVVNEIVKSYNGTITFKSTLNKGSTFKVTLPMIKAISKPTEPTLKKATKSEEGHIMLVDDEESITKLYTRYLGNAGYQVTAFNDSQQALNFILQNGEDIDLVITDQTMPKLTGTKLSNEIHKSKPTIPIILTTGNIASVTDDMAEISSVRKVLKKPIENSEFAREIRESLGRIDK